MFRKLFHGGNAPGSWLASFHHELLKVVNHNVPSVPTVHDRRDRVNRSGVYVILAAVSGTIYCFISREKIMSYQDQEMRLNKGRNYSYYYPTMSSSVHNFDQSLYSLILLSTHLRVP